MQYQKALQLAASHTVNMNGVLVHVDDRIAWSPFDGSPDAPIATLVRSTGSGIDQKLYVTRAGALLLEVRGGRIENKGLLDEREAARFRAAIEETDFHALRQKKNPDPSVCDVERSVQRRTYMFVTARGFEVLNSCEIDVPIDQGIFAMLESNLQDALMQ
jgi:hypothetical protein